MTHATRYSNPHLSPHLIIFLCVGRWGWPTSRRRWSRLVLLRVPMMRRPIFLAYHTELSMLLVAAAAVMKVEVACRLLCASTRSCCRLQGGGGGAGWRADDGRGASLHLVFPPLHPPFLRFLLFLTYKHREAAEELMEEVMEVSRCCFQQVLRRTEVVLFSVISSGGRCYPVNRSSDAGPDGKKRGRILVLGGCQPAGVREHPIADGERAAGRPASVCLRQTATTDCRADERTLSVCV